MTTSLMTYEEMCQSLRAGGDPLQLTRDKWARQLKFIEENFPEKVETEDVKDWIESLPLGRLSSALCETYITQDDSNGGVGDCAGCPIETCWVEWGEFDDYLAAYLRGGPRPIPLDDEKDGDDPDVSVNDLLVMGRRILEHLDDAIQGKKVNICE